jgi:CBS domain-containing protein
MTGKNKKNGLGKISDFLEKLQQRNIPKVNEDASLSEILDAFVDSDYSRIVYVVDNQERLKGIISLGNLIRHVFFLYHDTDISSRHLISMAVSETAKDLMLEKTLFALTSDDVESVLKRMIKHNVKEIAILDDEKRIIADLTMIDLLEHYKNAKGDILL